MTPFHYYIQYLLHRIRHPNGATQMKRRRLRGPVRWAGGAALTAIITGSLAGELGTCVPSPFRFLRACIDISAIRTAAVNDEWHTVVDLAAPIIDRFATDNYSLMNEYALLNAVANLYIDNYDGGRATIMTLARRMTKPPQSAMLEYVKSIVSRDKNHLTRAKTILDALVVSPSFNKLPDFYKFYGLLALAKLCWAENDYQEYFRHMNRLRNEYEYRRSPLLARRLDLMEGLALSQVSPMIALARLESIAFAKNRSFEARRLRYIAHCYYGLAMLDDDKRTDYINRMRKSLDAAQKSIDEEQYGRQVEILSLTGAAFAIDLCDSAEADAILGGLQKQCGSRPCSQITEFQWKHLRGEVELIKWCEKDEKSRKTSELDDIARIMRMAWQGVHNLRDPDLHWRYVVRYCRTLAAVSRIRFGFPDHPSVFPSDNPCGECMSILEESNISEYTVCSCVK